MNLVGRRDDTNVDANGGKATDGTVRDPHAKTADQGYVGGARFCGEVTPRATEHRNEFIKKGNALEQARGPHAHGEARRHSRSS